MNQFTKDELQEIAEMARHMRKQCIETTHNLSCEIEDKAWEMLENYCEHRFGVVYIDGSAHPRCKKCNRMPETTQ